MMTYGEMWKT